MWNGQRVRLFVDEHADGEAFFLDEAGELDLNVNRDASGNVTGIKGTSQSKAQGYLAAANEKEQFEYDEKALDELEDRITKRVNERYSDH